MFSVASRADEAVMCEDCSAGQAPNGAIDRNCVNNHINQHHDWFEIWI